jgi:hypothetical protein
MGTDLAKREGGEGFDAEGVYSDKNDVSLPFDTPFLLCYDKRSHIEVIPRVPPSSPTIDRLYTILLLFPFLLIDLSQEITPEGRQAISLVAEIINTFAAHDIPLTDTLILEGYTFLAKLGQANGPITPDIGREMIAQVAGIDV